jgi:hypothetical protein
VGLKTPAVTKGEVTDLTPLVPLVHLVSVVLIGNRIADLTPLSGHAALRTITVDYNAVTTLAGLSLSPPNCSELSLQHNPLGATEVAPICALGWFVPWGTSDDAGVAPNCNQICTH